MGARRSADPLDPASPPPFLHPAAPPPSPVAVELAVAEAGGLPQQVEPQVEERVEHGQPHVGVGQRQLEQPLLRPPLSWFASVWEGFGRGWEGV